MRRFTLAFLSILLAVVRPDIAWPFTSCGTGPYLVQNVTLTSTPTRNKNDTVKMFGIAKTALAMRNADLEVRLNGLHLDTQNMTYSEKYDSGDKTLFSYVNFAPSFAPVGTYTL
jgi:hypothetical protein